MTKDGIELIASGYDWWCPKCEMDAHVVELVEQVTCPQCDTDYEVESFDHAYKG